MKRVRVRARDERDRERAKRLERYLNSPRVLPEFLGAVERDFLNVLLYGRDRTRWPN